MNKKTLVQRLCLTGMMGALVFVSTFFSIQIPLPGINTMIHLGNVFCILSALLLGPIYGGLSAGIGSFFFDLLNPIYITSAPFTLVFKFIMAYLCGKIAYSKNKNGESLKYNILGASAGLITYIVLHLIKTFINNIFLGVQIQANLLLILQSGLVSIINAILAILISVPLSMSLNKVFKNKNIFN